MGVGVVGVVASVGVFASAVLYWQMSLLGMVVGGFSDVVDDAVENFSYSEFAQEFAVLVWVDFMKEMEKLRS